MRRCVWYQPPALPRLVRRVWLATCLALLCALTACGGRQNHYAGTHYKPSRYYPPPGPASDPWGPYIHEASGRFGVPELWIRRVMRQESGGQEDVISWAGAMGLMQVMPETYDGLRWRYSLGDDPFDPHNNILAGTAYLREMYDRFGAPGFLAAYNAGPNRLDQYLNDGMPLPEETVNYVAAIAPRLGPGTPMSGPLAVYANPVGFHGGADTQYAARQSSGGCNPDAAFNPDAPCAAARQPAIQAVVAAPAPSYAAAACDQDAAYDPARPCVPAPPSTTKPAEVAWAASPSYPPAGGCDSDYAYDPTRPCRPAPLVPIQTLASPPAVPPPGGSFPASSIMAEPLPPAASRRFGVPAAGASRPLQEAAEQRVTFNPMAARPGNWGIQVGTFANLDNAQAASDTARLALPELLRTVKVELPPTTPFGGKPAFRARLVGLTPTAARDACSRLGERGLPCLPVPPAKDMF
jgi:D-alanyl-D-alanine carboxypeptidase